MIIDAHIHIVPPAFLEQLRAGLAVTNMSLSRSGGREYLTVNGRCFPVSEHWFDQRRILNDMDARKIDLSIVSPSPFLICTWEPADQARMICQLVNDAVANFCAQAPDRFVGLGQVPLQDVPWAISELERITTQLDLKGVEVTANVNGIDLDGEEFLPFFQRAEELGTGIFVHPYHVTIEDRLKPYYLVNLIGNPLDTSIAMARFIFSGVLQRLPGLKLLFAHAGGFLPFIRGRLEHGRRVRPECRKAFAMRGSSFFGNCYVDTITHFVPALQYVIDTMGVDHVVLGSDYPFDMQDDSPVDTVGQLRLSASERRAVLGGNARKLFNL